MQHGSSHYYLFYVAHDFFLQNWARFWKIFEVKKSNQAQCSKRKRKMQSAAKAEMRNQELVWDLCR